MKIRIVSFLSTAVFALSILPQCDQAPQPKSLEGTTDALAKLPAMLPDSATDGSQPGDMLLQKNLSIQKRKGGVSGDSKMHPEPWLQNWVPGGRPASDLRVMFGEPAAESTETISFRWAGLVFNFTLKDGKIVSMERHLGEVPLLLDDLIQKRSGEDALRVRPFMEAWLGYWDPIGCTSAQLKTALGSPSGESAEMITYDFDGGFGGCSFEFKLQDGMIARIERRSID